MEKCINASDGFTLKDLTLKDGMVFEVSNNCENFDDEDFGYSTDIPLTNDEVLDLLNMDDFQDEDTCDDDNINNRITVCGISFKKLKTKMTNLFGDGKVMKLIKQEGVGTVIPCDAQVSIKYIAHFEFSDEPFDSSFAHGDTETLHLGEDSLLPGLEIGITSMKKHEIAMFLIHPDLAYGKYGCAPRIPPNEEVLFIVHLTDYVDNGSAKKFQSLSLEERRQFATAVKGVQGKFNTAKDYFSKKKIKQATKEYGKALQWLEETELKNQQEEDEVNKLLSRGYNNLAICYNMQNMPRNACNACNRVPIPTSKTHFNYGRALLKMGEFSRAMEKLQLALKMEPKNMEIVKEIKLANEKQRKYLDMEKKLWENCLKVKENKKKEPSAFEKVAYEICKSFSEDNQALRQPLPECLTPEEDKCIREQAAVFGLIVTTHQRYGREITYLSKANY
ncbi:inactive peptidyl-prolyl cis-trans isomerase FKBP6 isoform X1 [Bombus vosnesenskii]|uniref:peptidylprolyl isomerase n=2 Tax=Bombus vosnesenskii TaxID=207650 RepID=A0A6J3KZT9_9HYME|nr:inactive peptidyl-prolyl cis-trans isomerase FKBP6 isoform X1 [Bombus vosnesenskii]XP_050478032.1 inactive peptidyl-prolyl cis-trans isomerase FKBP6 [Bombus huntii]